MKFTLNLATISLFFTVGMTAQIAQPIPNRGCGTPAPGAEWDTWFNQKVAEHQQDLIMGRTQNTTYTVPVIVHVIHGGQAVGTFPNVSQAQINSQITVLNDDYAGIGLNSGNLAATGFSTTGPANCNVTFAMAQYDQSGNVLAEPGIDRVDYTANSWTNPASFTSQTAFQNYIDGTIKPNTVWDPTRYGNIWITDVNNGVGLLGYATFPAGSGLTGLSSNFGTASTDGIWVWTKAFGNTGAVQAPYHKGRTASHELGHWLGLRHIGGDANPPSCSSTDYCNDTPPQKGGFSGGMYGQNYGAPTYPLYATGTNSCSAAPFGNMFMNFMDYVDDPSCYMFTNNQATRMNTAMTSGTYRSQLTASSLTLCNIPTVMPTANFTMPTTGCVDSLIATNNQSSGTPIPNYSWSYSPNIGGVVFSPNNTSTNPNVKIISPGTYTIIMQAINSAGTTSFSSVVVVNDCQDSNVGIQSNSKLQKSIILSPNPSSGIVNITTSLPGIQNLDVTVQNYLGQFITSVTYKNAATETYSLDLNNYSNGVYFITFNNGQEKVVKRLILNK